MSPRLRKHLEALWASFWLVPLAMLAMGVAAGIALPILDGAVAGLLPSKAPWLDVSASGARAILSASATALTTVLAVAFSMTMLTVQLAATQFTSRLLGRFMRDGITKFVLGLYLATIAFLLLVLRAVRSRQDDGAGFVPSIAVLVGIVLALACLATLLVSLHRTTRSLQVATVIVSIGRETLVELESVAEGWVASDPHSVQDRAGGRTVHAVETGYLQVIDVERMVRALPSSADWVSIEQPTGSFVFPGMPLLSFGPVGNHRAERGSDERLHRALAVGRERTMSRDPLYGVRQLVDIALKALSPAINDPTTAVMVVNELGAIVASALQRGLPLEPWACRRIGETRVFQMRPAVRPLLFEAYDEIVVCARNQPRVLRRIIETLTAAAAAAGSDEPGPAAVLDRVAEVCAGAGRSAPAPDGADGPRSSPGDLPG